MIENIGVFTFIDGHTAKCREQQEQQAEAYTKYVEEYPNYCPACGGTGKFYFIKLEDSKLKTKATPCFCIDFHTCPRCDEEFKGLTCSHCGFVLGQTHGCPPEELDCSCEYLYERLKEKQNELNS